MLVVMKHALAIRSVPVAEAGGFVVTVACTHIITYVCARQMSAILYPLSRPLYPI